MKQSEKPVIICGIVLLMLAAYFTISLMLPLINFGTINSNILSIFSIGNVLFSVYGFTCLLIPVFLFVASIMMFMPNFTKKRAVNLAFSILPFYTVYATERICRTILPNSTTPVLIIKLSAALFITAMLIAIEYLAIGVAYDAIENLSKQGFKKNTKKTKEDDTIVEVQDDPELVSELEDEQFLNVATINENDINEVIDDVEEISDIDDISEIESIDDIDQIEDDYDDATIVEDDIITEPIEEFGSLHKIDGAVDLEPVDENEIDEVNIAESNSDDVNINENTEDARENDVIEVSFKNEAQKVVQPDEDEANFLNDPFGSDEDDDEVDHSAETEFMSEEERMNAVIPLIDVPLGDDEEIPQHNEHEMEEIDIDDINGIDNQQDEDSISKKKNSDDDDDSFTFEDDINEETNNTNEQLIDPLFINAHEENNDVVEEIVEDDDEQIQNEYVQTEKNQQEINLPIIESVPKRNKNAPYSIPSEGLLTTYPDGEYWVIDEDTKKAAVLLRETLSEFNIEAEVTGIRKGPVITMFEILPAPGVKLNKIVSLQDNIALRLAASSVRIVAPIPGKSAVGIEVPNKERAIVSFKELIDTDTPAYKKMTIPVVLGKDITGEAQLLDLAKTPHLLIAGSTGSGKSVCVNSMILSILYKRSPNEVKMILIDPKVVELKLYNDIPHLLTPVITEPKKAFQALQYCLCEMERRYSLLDGMGVRDIASYNRRIVERNIATEKLPYIVVVIDEFADLMATTGKELEATLARLAAMSRAVGIHLVLATQRPSIDVITGLIKANIPTRIAFMVASKMDSRIIIDQVGAEKLLGRGDMLYASATDPFPVRIQGTYVSDNEVENVVDFVKQYGEPEYIDEEIFVDDDEDGEPSPNLFGEGEDPLYNQALEIIIQAGKASASYIQRRLKIGYNRAARLVEEMEDRGIVGPANGSKPREIIHIP